MAAGRVQSSKPLVPHVQTPEPRRTLCSLLASGCGGIGRRARFRSVWERSRGGSSPLIRIVKFRSGTSSAPANRPFLKLTDGRGGPDRGGRTLAAMRLRPILVGLLVLGVPTPAAALAAS